MPSSERRQPLWRWGPPPRTPKSAWFPCLEPEMIRRATAWDIGSRRVRCDERICCPRNLEVMGSPNPTASAAGTRVAFLVPADVTKHHSSALLAIPPLDTARSSGRS